MNPRIFLSQGELSQGELSQGELTVSQRFVVAGDDGHHLARVLRVQPKESVAIGSGGKGFLAEVVTVDSGNGTVTLEVTQTLSSHESPVSVYLVQGLPKSEKTEYIIQHGTELGIAGFLLLQSARAVARLDKDPKKAHNRLERWQRVVKEAASQSQRDIIPSLHYAADWNALLKWLEVVAPGLILLLDEEEQARSLAQVLEAYESSRESSQESSMGSSMGSSQARPIVLCVGPEGGWDAAERKAFQNRLNATTVTLGPRILRTETAGIVSAAAVLYHFHALGG